MTLTDLAAQPWATTVIVPVMETVFRGPFERPAFERLAFERDDCGTFRCDRWPGIAFTLAGPAGTV